MAAPRPGTSQRAPAGRSHSGRLCVSSTFLYLLAIDGRMGSFERNAIWSVIASRTYFSMLVVSNIPRIALIEGALLTSESLFGRTQQSSASHGTGRNARATTPAVSACSGPPRLRCTRHAPGYLSAHAKSCARRDHTIPGGIFIHRCASCSSTARAPANPYHTPHRPGKHA